MCVLSALQGLSASLLVPMVSCGGGAGGWYGGTEVGGRQVPSVLGYTGPVRRICLAWPTAARTYTAMWAVRARGRGHRPRQLLYVYHVAYQGQRGPVGRSVSCCTWAEWPGTWPGSQGQGSWCAPSETQYIWFDIHLNAMRGERAEHRYSNCTNGPWRLYLARLLYQCVGVHHRLSMRMVALKPYPYWSVRKNNSPAASSSCFFQW